MLTALIVEDNALNQKLLTDILELHFEVVSAVSAEDAQMYLKTNRPDLLMLDMQLPGMNGITLTELLKADPQTADIPIVAISAHAMTENIEQALQAGCVEYVTKPILEDPDEFAGRMLKIATGHSS